MSIYYNPHKLRARRWIIATFICVPILLTIVTYMIGKKKAEEQLLLKEQLERESIKIDLNNLL